MMTIVVRTRLSPDKERSMKKHAAALLILTLVGLTGLVNAQVVEPRISAQVPFDFMANGKNMPAGECTITVRGDGAKVLWISSGSKSLFAIPNATESLKASEKTVLVFQRYGDRYFLARISRQGEAGGYEFPMSKLETELRAQNVPESDVIVLASLR
jgi:hypothetical protein